MRLRSFFLILFGFFCLLSDAQESVLIRGVVYDSTRLRIIPNVKVTSTGGGLTYTDSTGHYSILAMPSDSLSFTYRNKSTNRFPVKDIKYLPGFDISLQVSVEDKYKTLKEIVVIQKTHRQDSVENREKYARAFNYQSGGLRLTESNALYGGTPGFDPNEIINIFRFRRNRTMKSLQNRLLEEEAQKFIDYRFNRSTVKQLTGLEGEELRHFMRVYRPGYEFTASSPDYQFYQYILDASRLYKRGIYPPEENTLK